MWVLGTNPNQFLSAESTIHNHSPFKRRLMFGLVTEKNKHNILLPKLLPQGQFAILEITLDVQMNGLQKTGQVLCISDFQCEDI